MMNQKTEQNGNEKSATLSASQFKKNGPDIFLIRLWSVFEK